MFSGQWSPMNPAGKKQYDREFLLKLQAAPDSRKAPHMPDMPDIFVDVSVALLGIILAVLSVGHQQ
jgi:hypothetical protein